MTEPIEVIDDTEQHRFVYREPDGEAELAYRVHGGRLVLIHTSVPEALSGRGIGGRLVRAAVDRAATTGETIAPWCQYARRWLERHPDEAAAIAIDWSPPPRP